jgi:hypothetical protein
MSRPQCLLEQQQSIIPQTSVLAAASFNKTAGDLPASADLGPSLGVYTPDSATNSVNSMHGGTPGQQNNASGYSANNEPGSNIMESPNSISSSVDMNQGSNQMMDQTGGTPQHMTTHTTPQHQVNYDQQQQHLQVSQQQQQQQHQAMTPQQVSCHSPHTVQSPIMHLPVQSPITHLPVQSPITHLPVQSPITHLPAQSPHHQQQQPQQQHAGSLPSQSPHSQHNMTSPHPQPSPHAVNSAQTSPHPMSMQSTAMAHSPYNTPTTPLGAGVPLQSPGTPTSGIVVH